MSTILTDVYKRAFSIHLQKYIFALVNYMCIDNISIMYCNNIAAVTDFT